MKLRKAHGAIWWVLVIAGIGAAGSVALGVAWFSRPEVTVTRVVEGQVVDSFYATGTVQPVTEYPIKAANAGMITRVLVDKGDAVTEGQELAYVEDPQLKYKLEKAAADLEQARLRADEKTSPVLKEFDAKLLANGAMLKNGKAEEARFREMRAKGGASQSDLDKAADHVLDLQSQGAALAAQREAVRIQLQTDLHVAEAAKAAAQTDFDWQTLRSPIRGVVLDRPTPQGTRLNVNDHLMQLANVAPDNLRMRAAVDEENKAQLTDGQLVRMALYAFPGRVFDGKVTKIYPKADPDRRTFEVDVLFDPPEAKLAAGLTGELAFIVQEKSHALIAPAQALQHGKLFTIRDGRFIRLAAQIGIRSVERIEILGGLKLGDTIVISPAQDLREGTRVRVKEIDPAVAAGLNKPSGDNARNPLGGR
jgi:multidrug efflux pump subunit AcrA (membrane-fusion protein)